MTAFTATMMEIEFTPGTWTDVTADCRLPVTIRSGRKTAFEEITPSEMTFTLNNPSGDYTPENAGGAHYPNVTKGIRCRWTVTKAGTDYVRAVMRIQRWQPSWPSSGDYRKGTVQIRAVDDLGLLGQRRLRSNFTETVLWRGRASTVAVDAWEATGKTTGVEAFLTNYSEDSTPGSAGAAYNEDDPILSFGGDADASFGQVVTANTGNEGRSCTTLTGFQENPLQVIVHFKTPSDVLDSNYWTVCTLNDSGGTSIGHLIISINGGENGLFLMNYNQTVNLGLITDLPRGQWVKLQFLQNATNANKIDVTCYRVNGTSGGITNKAIDIRDIAEMEIPGALNRMCPGSWGGIAALGTRTTIATRSSFVAGSGANLAGRVTAIADMCDRLPVTIATTGTPTTTAVLTGDLSGRAAAEVLRELARSAGALVWARPRDSAIYVIASILVRPATPIATISLQDDCTGPPTLDDTTATQPTRIDVDWPGGVVTAVDATAEAAGEQRSASISTVCATAAALAIGENLLAARSSGLRIASVTVDLVGAVTDHTAEFFDATATLEGLYPSARIRLALPAGLLGVSTVDAYVEGWTERYDDGTVTVELDTSPAT